MKNIWIIIKKELARVFKDFRLILNILILPGLMIFLTYNLIGDAIKNANNDGLDKTAEIYTLNVPDRLQAMLEFENEGEKVLDANYNLLDINELEEKKAILNKGKGEVDLILVFDEDFENKAYNKEKPNLQVYYNPTSNLSMQTYQKFSAILDNYKSLLSMEIFDDTTVFNKAELQVFDEKAAGKAFASLFPFLIISFAFSGAMSVGPESIAGEKERGTLATLLITPTKRSHIAFAKMISLSILAVISAISSFLGVALSLPKLFGEADISPSIYGFSEYFGTFLILVVTCFVIIGLISVISAYARNVKEANLYVTPLFLITTIVSVSTMFISEPPANNFLYLIPIYNSVEVLMGLFSFNFNMTHMIITVCSNLAFTILLTFILTRMFNSERIMFSN